MHEPRTDEDRNARTRAGRWLLAAAAVWLSMPLASSWTSWQSVVLHNVFFWSLALLLLWAARMSRDRRLRSAILTRAIVVSNLLIAFLYSPWLCLATALVAVTAGRSLHLLGERGLDGSDDHDSRFEPVKFRGILILALIMACADASLLFACTVTRAVEVLLVSSSPWTPWYPDSWLPRIGLTALATMLMGANVWGLLRLRTWALLGNMFASAVIVALILERGMLTTTTLDISFLLLATGTIQLLLPLPILAAALGLGEARWYDRFGTVLVRLIAPGLVLATIVSAFIFSVTAP